MTRAKEEATAIIGGQRKPVDVQAIESELTRLWEQAAQMGTDEGEGGQPVTRACILNLLVYAPKPRMSEGATEIINTLMAAYPCRAIVMSVDPQTPEPSLAAWISAHCQLTEADGTRVCCEQITIAASGSSIDTLDMTVVPLLVPELPVILWWMTGLPAQEPLFRRLIPHCDRLIVDSGTVDPAEQVLSNLIALRDALPERCRLWDLTWGRLTPWRAQLARLLDGPAMRPHLSQLDRLKLEYAWPDPGTAPAPVQALLLAGWLTDYVGWKMGARPAPPAEGQSQFKVRAADRAVAVDIQPVRLSDVPPGTVTGVHLAVSSGEAPVTFSVILETERSVLVTKHTTAEAETILETTDMPSLGLAQLVGAALEPLKEEDERAFTVALELGAAFAGGS